jgi:hypothetical protein
VPPSGNIADPVMMDGLAPQYETLVQSALTSQQKEQPAR